MLNVANNKKNSSIDIVGCNKPKVSIIICAYNAEEFIEDTLKSVLAQTWKNLEVIVVDDGSVDNTAQIINKFSSFVCPIYQENQGSSAARNKGILKSSGDYLCFFDADDVMRADRIARQVAFMESYPEMGLSFVDYRNFDCDGKAQVTHFQTCSRLQTLLHGRKHMVLAKPCEALLHENFGITGTMMIRRSMLKSVSGFAEELRGGEDFHFYYRIARHTAVGVLCAEGMLRRLHASNVSGHRSIMLPDNVRYCKQLLQTEDVPSARRLLRAKLSKSWGEYARFEANRRHFFSAIAYEHRALIAFPAPAVFLRYLKNICRIMAIALGAHVPSDR